VRYDISFRVLFQIINKKKTKTLLFMRWATNVLDLYRCDSPAHRTSALKPTAKVKCPCGYYKRYCTIGCAYRSLHWDVGHEEKHQLKCTNFLDPNEKIIVLK
jgi:hypothetical protein